MSTARPFGYFNWADVARAAVAAVAVPTIACHSADHTPGSHFADGLVIGIRDVKIARSFECDVIWDIQLGRCGRSTVAAVTVGTVSCHSADYARGSHFADAVIVAIRDVEIACMSTAMP